MWRLCIEDDEANRTVVNLVRKEYTIGRAEENAVRLTERNVSRKHAVLRRTDDGWVLQDLSSHTGSFINDRPAEAEQSVDHRDRLRIGDYDITLLDSDREAEEDGPDKQTETIPSSAETDETMERHDRLVVVEGPNPGTQYPLLDKRLLVGRGEECDLALPDTSVSRVHATLLKDEHGRYHISDQQSSNGVRVNGMEITKIPLYSGDVVELGDVHLQFVPKGARFDDRVLNAKPTTSQPPRRGSGKLWLAALVAAAAGAVMWVGFQRNVDREPAPLVTAETSLLTQAQAQLERSNLNAAHALLQRIPATSPERQSPLFRSIAAAWADQQFELAEMSGERHEQIALLEQVANDELVDEVRRQRATVQLTHLSEVVAESDLAMMDAGDTTAVPALPSDEESVAVAAPSAPVPRKSAAPKPAARPTPKPAARPTQTPRPPAPPPRPAPAPKPTPVPVPGPTAVPRPTTAAPQPTPAPQPPPTPKPAPTPRSTSVPAPQPTPQPPVAPAPRPTPTGAPAPGGSPPVTTWPSAPAPRTP